MTQSYYGGYDGEDSIKVLRHETRQPEYLIIGEPPSANIVFKYEPYYDLSAEEYARVHDHDTAHSAVYYPSKDVVEEWVSEYTMTDLENATLHVYGFRRFHVAWFWKKEEK